MHLPSDVGGNGRCDCRCSVSQGSGSIAMTGHRSFLLPYSDSMGVLDEAKGMDR
jgi:hypothetical protein